jgi:hypothetical protein
MPCRVFLLTFPEPWSRFKPARSQWGIFVPTGPGCCVGKIIHIVGSPADGYTVEFIRQYNLTSNSRTWRQWLLGMVDEHYIDGGLIVTGSLDGTGNAATPEPATTSPGAGPATADDFRVTKDSIPRDVLERIAIAISPPGPNASILAPDTVSMNPQPLSLVSGHAVAQSNS